MNTDAIGLRPGWLPAVASMLVGAATTAIIVTSATELVWITTRISALGLVLLAIGVVVGSERLVGLASLPLLAGALFSVDGAAGPAWGRSIVLGCLWYISLELAWGSIEHRGDTVRAGAIDRRRMQEVARIVIISVAVGLLATAAATLAPTRTLLIRAVVVGGVLLGISAAVRQLTRTSTPVPSPSERG